MVDRLALSRPPGLLQTAALFLVALSLVGGVPTPLTAAPAGPPLDIVGAEVTPLEPMALATAFERAAEASREASAPVWLTWRVESIGRSGSICCHRSSCCDLEDDRGFYHGGELDRRDDPVLLFARFDRGEVRRLRLVSADCSVGLDGRRVLWLGEVPAEESLSLLGGWIEERHHRLADDAIVAVAYHRTDAATDLLARIATTSTDDDLAHDAIFWLGTTRGRAGFEALDALLAGRPDSETMEAIVFALSQSPVALAEERLVEIATRDLYSDVRGKALFWLGQSGEEHADLILEAALADPSDDVAEHAVFVLSQLPEPRNVELLTEVLIQQRRPELRKEALFWIGQSSSPEALEIVSRILNE